MRTPHSTRETVTAMPTLRFFGRHWVPIVACLLCFLAVYDIFSRHSGLQDQNVVISNKSDTGVSIREAVLVGGKRDQYRHSNDDDEVLSIREYLKSYHKIMSGNKLQYRKQGVGKPETAVKIENSRAEEVDLDPDLDVVVIEGKILRAQREREQIAKRQASRNQLGLNPKQNNHGFKNKGKVSELKQPYPGFDPNLDVIVIKGRMLKEQLKQQRNQDQNENQYKYQLRSRFPPRVEMEISQTNFKSENKKDDTQQLDQQQAQQQQEQQQQQQQGQGFHQNQMNKKRYQPESNHSKKVVSSTLRQQLKDLGLEPIEDHEFKSQYIINPKVYGESRSRSSEALSENPSSSSPTKLISLYNMHPWFSGPRHTYNMDNKMCPYRCEVDTSGKRRSKADVLLIFTGYLNGSRSLPSPRPPSQIWVHLFRESPVHYGYPTNYNDWKSVFNWTWTYRTDSDVFSPYGFLSWRHKDLLLKDKDYKSIAKSKTRMAVQFASHCETQSERDRYVREMQEHIDVDVYGKCGTLQCPKNEQDACDEKINSTYMFYLSFENSFCDDYVSEKFFRLFSKRLQVVHVVRGGANYKKYFPEGAYINAADFSSAKDLALYLKELSKNTTMYAQKLKEKDKLVSPVYYLDWCDLCEKVHTDKNRKTIPDIKAWSHYEGVCSKPPN